MIETEMHELITLFKIHRATSKAFLDHDRGDVPFVSNGFENNGIVGLVEPLQHDKVFHFCGICISAFSEATVQFPPFIARGNGGSGLSVLEPLKPITKSELYWCASYINQAIRWRFSFGRMLKRERVEKLQLPTPQPATVANFSTLIPSKVKNKPLVFDEIRWNKFKISELFNVARGDFHSLSHLNDGDVMTISRIAENNGVAGHFEKPEQAQIYKMGDLTVSTLGSDTFIQANEFMATDNVLILTPNNPMSVSVRLFIVYMLNRDKWRYSYGRQSYKTKFELSEILLPVNDDGSINDTLINSVVEQTTYWHLIAKVFNN